MAGLLLGSKFWRLRCNASQGISERLWRACRRRFWTYLSFGAAEEVTVTALLTCTATKPGAGRLVVVSLVGFRSTCRLPQLLHMKVKRTINVAVGPHSAAPQPALSEVELLSLIALLCLTRGCENEHSSIERSRHVPSIPGNNVFWPMLSAGVVRIAITHLTSADGRVELNTTNSHLPSCTML